MFSVREKIIKNMQDSRMLLFILTVVTYGVKIGILMLISCMMQAEELYTTKVSLKALPGPSSHAAVIP